MTSTINLYNTNADHLQAKVNTDSVAIHVNTLPLSLKGSKISIENVAGNVVPDLVETVLNTIQSVTDETTSRTTADNILQTDIDTNTLGLSNFIATKATTNGLCPLVGGVIPNAHIPPLAISKPTVYASIALRDADSTVESGDVAIVTDVGKTFIYTGTTYTELISTGSISSINAKSGGVVTLDPA